MKKIIGFIIMLMLPVATIAKDFNYTEVNTFVTSGSYTIGARENINKDASHRILRYDFKESPYRIEYRYVSKGRNHESWFRFQRKWFNVNGIWFNHRFEHRIRENKNDVFRYRPQFGYKSNDVNLLGGVPFITFEPQWNHTYKNGKSEYSHLQTFTGIEYKINSAFKIVPYIEVDFNDSMNKDIAFFILDFKYNMSK